MTNGAGPGGPDAQSPAASNLPRRAVTPLPPGATPLEPSDPQRVGEYRLLATLGVGGMGSVYLGQATDGPRVAVKVVHPHLASDPEFLRRFAAEVHAARKVPAFCTAPVRDSGTHNGRPYLITDFLEGIPLSRLIADDGPLDAATLHGLAVGAAAALTAIHGAGVVHRDLKPSNLVVTLGGVRVIDFGIARSLDIVHSHTRTGVILGSLGWASPEQLNAAPATPAMDVFGWGCLVAYASTGRHPFGGEEAAIRAWRILHADPEVDDLPASLRGLVRAALQREPTKRPTARELLLTLTQANGVGGEDGVREVVAAPSVAAPKSPNAGPAAAAPTAVPASAAAAAAASLNAGPDPSAGEARANNRRRVAMTAATVPLALAVVFAAVKASTSTGTGDPAAPRRGDTSVVGSANADSKRKPGGGTDAQAGDASPTVAGKPGSGRGGMIGGVIGGGGTDPAPTNPTTPGITPTTPPVVVPTTPSTPVVTPPAPTTPPATTPPPDPTETPTPAPTDPPTDPETTAPAVP